uniref:Uncharacterized protein n=1 Tax=Romanomermis culicivorax TaxID=13658 RepID=A0A915KMI6_ROMCU
YKTRLDLWSNLLDTVRDLASSNNEEIAVESLKCFNDLMSNSALVSPTITHNHSKHETNEDSIVKCHAWTIWLDIGHASQDHFVHRSPDSQFLRLLLRLFILLFDLAKDLVEPKTISKSYCVFKHIVEIPFVQLQTPLNRRPPLLIAFNSDEMLTCHRLLLDCVKTMCQELSLTSSPMNTLSAEFVMFCTSLANSCWEYTKCMDYDV